jgi:hypothetical protein
MTTSSLTGSVLEAIIAAGIAPQLELTRQHTTVGNYNEGGRFYTSGSMYTQSNNKTIEKTCIQKDKWTNRGVNRARIAVPRANVACAALLGEAGNLCIVFFGFLRVLCGQKKEINVRGGPSI